MESSVRSATYSDIQDILAMAAKFWAITDFEEEFCDDSAINYINLAMQQEMFSVIEIDGKLEGMAAAVAAPLIGNGKTKIGQELCWWINPEHRNSGNALMLLKHLEDSAREAGVKYFVMIALESSSPERAEKIYRASGYDKIETSFVRVL